MRTGFIAPRCCNGKISRVNQPCAVQTAGGLAGDDSVVRNADAVRGGFNKAAAAAARCRGIQRTADIHCTRTHTPQQVNDTVLVVDRLRFNDAGVVDHAGQQRIFRACAHDDIAAIGLNQTAILRQTVQHALVYLHLHQIVAAESQSDGAAGTQCSGAQLGGDRAGVAYRVTYQRNVFTIQAALIDDTARAIAGKTRRIAIHAYR